MRVLPEKVATIVYILSVFCILVHDIFTENL